MDQTPPVVLITGAAGGIGAATAQHFLKQGWSVVATMRSTEKAGRWTHHPRCLVVQLDVTEASTIAQAVEITQAQWGRIDVLVNNAGYRLTGPLEGVSFDQLYRQFEVNVFGLVAVTQRVLPLMRQQRSGVVINISSIGGRMAFPFASPYHATKFAVEGLSESLRFELGQHGIRVKIVEPGGIQTDFITRSQQWATHAAYEPEISRFKAMTVRLNETLPGPSSVARVIYQAAVDRSGRLRYTAKAGPYLKVKAVLPDWIWCRMVGAMLNQQAGS